MSEHIFKRFPDDDLNNVKMSYEERQEPPLQKQQQRFNEMKRKRMHPHNKCGGKVDVRSFLPRASATSVIQTANSSGASGSSSSNNKEIQHFVENNNNKPIQLKKLEIPEIPKGADRWKPADDLLLTISVLQLNDLKTVYALSKFSCKFTLAELETRWNALLYNELVSSTSAAGIRKMHPEQRAAVHFRAPFSLAEEEILCDLNSKKNPSLYDFQQLLEKFADTFYATRTAKCLQKHWNLLKRYELLCDQQPTNSSSVSGNVPPPSFSDVELEPLSNTTEDPVLEGHINQELKLWDQQIKYKIRLLEDENDHWMQLVNNLPSGDFGLKPQFGASTFALLRGQHLRYEMRKRLITFGRQSNNTSETIDVDLSIEGPVSKISRLQGIIELNNDGVFTASNFGKYPFFVNGKPILIDRKANLHNNSLLEISGITLIFYIHKEFVEETCFGNGN